jgi:hypothetical protein
MTLLLFKFKFSSRDAAFAANSRSYSIIQEVEKHVTDWTRDVSYANVIISSNTIVSIDLENTMTIFSIKQLN